MLYGVLMGYIGFFIYHHPYDRGEEKRTVGWAFFFKKTRVLNPDYSKIYYRQAHFARWQYQVRHEQHHFNHETISSQH
jgi:hypothetical protein